jgi:hypothetical protein
MVAFLELRVDKKFHSFRSTILHTDTQFVVQEAMLTRKRMAMSQTSQASCLKRVPEPKLNTKAKRHESKAVAISGDDCRSQSRTSPRFMSAAVRRINYVLTIVQKFAKPVPFPLSWGKENMKGLK